MGFDRQLDLEYLRTCWELALGALESLASALKVQFILFKDFTELTGEILPIDRLGQYSRIGGRTFCQLAVPFPSVEAYLASLAESTRRALCQGLKRAQAVTVERTREPGRWLERIYGLYRQRPAQSGIGLGFYSRLFFEQICQTLTGAEYLLFFLDGQLVSFDLVIRSGDRLVEKCLAFDSELGRGHNLYFRTWMEKVEICIEHRLPELHTGSNAESLKVKMGAQSIPSVILLRHRNPLVNRLVRHFTVRLAYEPELVLPDFVLGGRWLRTADGGTLAGSSTTPVTGVDRTWP